VVHGVAGLFAVSIMMPAAYCAQHGCEGPDLDGFMPALFLAPFGTVAVAVSLWGVVRRLRGGGAWVWVLWPVAVGEGVILAGVAGVILVGVSSAVWRKPGHLERRDFSPPHVLHEDGGQR
jgi:hypothetical protein